LQHHLTEFLKTATITPVLNQVELHPQLAQPELVEFCRSHGIAMEAWASLMQGQIFEIPLIAELAERYHKTSSQIALKWAVQKGFAVIPKSSHPARIRENFELFDFTISDEDMARLAALDTGRRIGAHPDHIDW
jgi:diketogulonate reductase-like aldo/keto reductase